MTSRKDEEAVQVDYFYDSASRLTKREKTGASTNIDKYTYDALGRMVTADCGTTGTSSSVSRSILSYDPLSRITQESQAILGGTAKLIKFTADKAGRRISTIYHDNVTTLTYGYDSRDRGTAINKDGLSLASYSWFGGILDKRQVTSQQTYVSGGFTDRMAYKTEFQREGLARVTKVLNELITRDQAHTARCNLGSWTYSYDAANNPLSEIHAGHTMGRLQSSRNYAYDSLDRVTQALLTDSQDWSALAQSTTTYTYDDLGNRISSNDRGAGAIGYGHDKANRMTTLAAVSPAYDLAGNMTLAFSEDRGTSYKYRYDHLNRLTGLYDSTNTTRKAAFAYDAFGRRIEHVDDVTGITQRYYYDGANEVATWDEDPAPLSHWVHGLSYIDERVMMWRENHFGPGMSSGLPIQRPYYYAIDRMYNARALVDRAGAIVERYVYDPYGKPLIRESAGRGDHNNDSVLNGLDISPFLGARDGSTWDPRADLNDDGLVDGSDTNDMFVAKQTAWGASPTVAQAFSDVGNPFMFQGRPNFPIDTALNATTAKNWLNDFRNRFADPNGRWLTRDPIGYAGGINLYELLASRPTTLGDPFGFTPVGTHRNAGDGIEGDADAAMRRRDGSGGAMGTGRTRSDGGDWLAERTAEGVLGVTDAGIAAANGVVDGAYNLVTDPIGSINRAADRVIDRYSTLLSLFLYGVDPRDFSYTSWDQRLGAGLLLGIDLLGFVEMGMALHLVHFECFAEGTLVATPDGPVPIETLKVGDRVVSDKSDCDLQWLDFPDDLLQIELQAFKIDGSSVDITLLRSKGWVSDAGVAPGRTVELTIPEIALAGDATVLAVGPAPTIKKGSGRVVRSTIRSLSDEVLEVSFEDGSQPLLVTVQHRLFSADRNDWVAARDLQDGETLQTRRGFLRIKSIQLTDRRYPVYNLQVDADYTFFVTEQEVLCHNTYPKRTHRHHDKDEDLGGADHLQDPKQKSSKDYDEKVPGQNYPEITDAARNHPPGHKPIRSTKKSKQNDNQEINDPKNHGGEPNNGCGGG